ncbi:MAG: glycosyltransferase, partial [Hymenobacter sp.]
FEMLELQAEAQVLFERDWSFNRGYVARRYDLDYVQRAVNQAPAVWEIGAGANMAFRKSVFEEVGYFDELLGAGAAGCGDDSEMWYRILVRGHAIAYNPQAIVYHEHRKEVATLKRQLFYYMRGHAVAALVQQAQQPQSGYARYLYRKLPTYYFHLFKHLLRTDFPAYRGRTRTLWMEVKGVLSGIAFYYRHRQPGRQTAATQPRVVAKPYPLVSVIITCYNHGRYLLEAFTSVWEQDYPAVEILVIDDGSTDDTRAITLRYPSVRYYYQTNQGLSAARNAGIAHSTGQYLLFLDADDWLLPQALRTNVAYLQQNPKLAFVSGGHHKVYTATGTVKHEQWPVTSNHYLHLLRGNYIGMHAAVLYQRWAFDTGQYDPSLRSCEDYDMYLRLARTFPVAHHTTSIAAYRLHDTNMSSNTALMLSSVLAVLKRQQPLLKNAKEAQAYASGYAIWQAYYAPSLPRRAIEPASSLAAPSLLHSRTSLPMLKKLLKNHAPGFGLRLLHKANLYPGYRPAVGQVASGDLQRLRPFSNEFGYDRGGPLDRYYIENFLQKEAPSIRGRVLEIGDNSYTLHYGGARVGQSDVLHVDASNPQATFVGDLSNAPHIPDNTFDCLVLTQTLHLIYDFKSALRTCYRILKPGGTLLLTVPGITPIDRGEWKETWYWTFTDKALQRLFAETFPVGHVDISSFGNVRVATAYLYGMGLPEVDQAALDYYDPQFQVINAVRAVKHAPLA